MIFNYPNKKYIYLKNQHKMVTIIDQLEANGKSANTDWIIKMIFNYIGNIGGHEYKQLRLENDWRIEALQRWLKDIWADGVYEGVSFEMNRSHLENMKRLDDLGKSIKQNTKKFQNDR